MGCARKASEMKISALDKKAAFCHLVLRMTYKDIGKRILGGKSLERARQRVAKALRCGCFPEAADIHRPAPGDGAETPIEFWRDYGISTINNLRSLKYEAQCAREQPDIDRLYNLANPQRRAYIASLPPLPPFNYIDSGKQ